MIVHLCVFTNASRVFKLPFLHKLRSYKNVPKKIKKIVRKFPYYYFQNSKKFCKKKFTIPGFFFFLIMFEDAKDFLAFNVPEPFNSCCGLSIDSDSVISDSVTTIFSNNSFIIFLLVVSPLIYSTYLASAIFATANPFPNFLILLFFSIIIQLADL